MNGLNEKLVLITGAASGIGLATAHEVVRRGARVVLTDIDEAGLSAAADSLRGVGATVFTRTVDVSDREQVMAMADWVRAEAGPLDVLVNNAGIGHSGPIATTPIEVWHRLIDVNLLGPIHHMHAFMPDMVARRSGRIVNVSSGQAFFRLPAWGAYAAIKLALGALSEGMDFEARKHGVRVVTVYPFMVTTGFYEGIQGETPGARMMLRLRRLYSMSPQAVARILVNAVVHDRHVERVSILNDIGYYTRMVPPIADLVTWLTEKVLINQDAA